MSPQKAGIFISSAVRAAGQPHVHGQFLLKKKRINHLNRAFLTFPSRRSIQLKTDKQELNLKLQHIPRSKHPPYRL